MNKTQKTVVSACISILCAATVMPASHAAVSSDAPLMIQRWVESDMSGSSWGFRAVNAPAAHAAGYKGSGVTVAVIDTGVDDYHTDLRGQTVSGYTYGINSTGSKFTVTPVPAGDNFDEVSHGTHVAGIIAARADGRGMTGVAPRAKILPISILNSSAGGLSYTQWNDALADAILRAAGRGARVINMSLGGSALEPSITQPDVETAQMAASDQRVCDAIEKARDTYGTISVVASGNEGADGLLDTPANCPAAVSVASVDSDFRPSWFSSYDATVDIAAPGSHILSTVPDGYSVYQGTSMAAPHVAAIAALLIEQNPTATATDIIERLESTATDVHTPGFDVRSGYGLVNAAAALGIDAPLPQTEESFGPYLRDAKNGVRESIVYRTA